MHFLPILTFSKHFVLKLKIRFQIKRLKLINPQFQKPKITWEEWHFVSTTLVKFSDQACSKFPFEKAGHELYPLIKAAHWLVSSNLASKISGVTIIISDADWIALHFALVLIISYISLILGSSHKFITGIAINNIPDVVPDQFILRLTICYEFIQQRV